MDKIMSYGLFCFAALNNRFLNCSARDKCIKRNQIKSKQTKFKSKLISHNIKWYFSNMGPLGGSQVLKFYSRNPTIIQRITKTTFVSFYFSNFKLINLNFISIIFLCQSICIDMRNLYANLGVATLQSSCLGYSALITEKLGSYV